MSTSSAKVRHLPAALVLLGGCGVLASADDAVGYFAGACLAFSGAALLLLNWSAQRKHRE